MARGRTWLISVLLLALVLRLMAAFVVQQQVGGQLCLIAGDADGYWKLAQRIAAGKEFSLYDPPRRIHRMPGFPVVLALSMTLFGQSVIAARCLLAVVGTAACGAVYLLGRRLFDEQVGLLACVLSAISPVMAGFSVLLLSETLFALALTLSVWLAAKWLEEEKGEEKGSGPFSRNPRSRFGWA
ncbi:MAG TPA: glycosyltransferase family 39 protein, partial [Planctomycetaceae bacterium]|nr:glycosyltransferase family 39 protein [Planctomycetaceae bacterium]